MVIRASEIAPSRVTVRPSDFLEAVIVALESGEFQQLRGRTDDGGNGRCAYGVAFTVGARAGMSPSEVSGALGRPWQDAGRALGYGHIAAANYAGVDFATIARALRQAREQAQVQAG